MKQNKPFESQITKLSLLPSLMLLFLLLLVMMYAHISTPLTLLVLLISSIVIIYCNLTISQKIYYQFRSISNLLEAMIHGDYTLRSSAMSRETSNSAYNELSRAINNLADRLSQQRLQVIENQMLLTMVIDHIDVAILTLDDRNQTKLMNPAAKNLLSEPSAQASLNTLLNNIPQEKQDYPKVMPLSFGKRQGKFNIHIETFLQNSIRHKLLFITDLSAILRDEERNAWRNLVRVISHEINNSLTPISSISETLIKTFRADTKIENAKEIVQEGLSIIAERSNSLKGFVNSYKKLAQLPNPDKKDTSILMLIKKTCALFRTFDISYPTDKDIILYIDPIQIEQVLINLIKNAFEATENVRPQGKVSIDWKTEGKDFYLWVYDEGTGISNTENLFIPFYTTKKQGSGIGLVLSRQILEGHEGTLILQNREDTQGCKATLKIKL